MKDYNVAIVGATGAVGQEMINMIEMRNFPVKNLRLFASERSVGRKLKFKNEEVTVENLHNLQLTTYDLRFDLALFSAGATISKEFAPIFAKENIFVIDNSSAFRMEKDIPLVVPEVNPHTLSKDKKIIANPNCSTIQMVVVLKPLHDAGKIKRVVVSTYQSTSGAGARAMDELKQQTLAWAKNEPIPLPQKFSYQIAFNVIPHIDIFLDNNYTKEEMKMTNETRKIMGDDSIQVSATTVRVPVFRGHSEAVWIETEKKISPEKAKEILKKSPGIEVIDDPSNKKYPLPIFAEGKQTTYVGRIREDISCKNGLVLWIVSDNLLKGAALNAVQIAELLIERRII